MSLDYSIAQIMARLTDWAGFPKYQLERRVDIFLTPFLESFLSARLGPARLVAPEFPILRSLREAGPRADRTKPALTANADYLLRVGGGDPCWLLLELKTDPGSFESEQADLYAVAKERTMPELFADAEWVHGEAKAVHATKYQRLLDRLRREAGISADVAIGYLAPASLREDVLAHAYRAPTKPLDPTPFPKTVSEKHFFSLEEFARQDYAAIPPEVQGLWPYVRDMLLGVEASRVRRPA